MQHFEFGLFGLMPFHPSDAFFASIDPVASTLPNGAVRPEQHPRRRRA